MLPKADNTHTTQPGNIVDGLDEDDGGILLCGMSPIYGSGRQGHLSAKQVFRPQCTPPPPPIVAWVFNIGCHVRNHAYFPRFFTYSRQ